MLRRACKLSTARFATRVLANFDFFYVFVSRVLILLLRAVVLRGLK